MCGTFGFNVGDLKARVFKEFYGNQNWPEGYDDKLRVNIKPQQEGLNVVVSEEGERRVEAYRWGLVPSWAKDPGIGYKTFNARGETVALKNSFRSAFKQRRSLVPASYFIEWMKTADGSKQPHLIKSKDGGMLTFAGLWESPAGGLEKPTFTLITTQANDFMKPIHNRMPVILEPGEFELWLDHSVTEREALEPLLKSCPSDWLESYPVTKRFNSWKNNDPSMVEPIELEPVKAQVGLDAFGG